MRRRDVEKLAISSAVSLLAGCPSPPREPRPIDVTCSPGEGTDVDYVIVGSGAGGGPLACGLARRGFNVLLLEAGGHPRSLAREVPALHPAAVEDPSLRWDFFVRHYADDAQHRRNEKLVEAKNGILYPRAATLGGCTAHNALITIYPHNQDWDDIAKLFGDASWRASNMRKYFERLERCDYAPPPDGGKNPSRHGFEGWLTTTTADPRLVLGDMQLSGIIAAAVSEARRINPRFSSQALSMVLNPSQALWDPNDWRMVQAVPEGMVFVPLHVNRGVRTSTRDYVLAVAAACPGRLRVELDALACRVLFDGTTAVGVEYQKGASLYRASPRPNRDAGERRVIRVRREVILCGGVFNSPQLLMLSGIGPKAELERHGIAVLIDRPGVGKNLQDRYEIGVVSRMAQDFAVIEDAELREPDPQVPDAAFERWQSKGDGPYATNGVIAALIKKSRPDLALPDLFVFGLVGSFKGYYPGYSRDLVRDKRHFTWGILKGHTHNTAGEVRLRSADPRDTPLIDFHYFDEGAKDDLDAMVEGVFTARRIMHRLKSVVEVVPGPNVRTRGEVRRFVRDNAWGHHASCSNKMGLAGDEMAVVDNRFRVHGTRNLRVVDASVFPKIPGFFIVSSVYMIAEKAVDVIAEDAAEALTKVSG